MVLLNGIAVRVVLLSAVAALYLSLPAGADPYPKPPPEHPRLLLRAADIPGVRARLDSPQMAAVKAKILEQASATSDGRLPDGKPDRAKRRAYEAKALLCLLNGDEDAGRQAAQMALEYLASLSSTYKEDGLFVSRDMNRSILGAAMVYDWCYPLLTREQRTELIEQIKHVAANTEYGWPVNRAGFVSGHYGEETHPCMLAAGIAVYDEEPSIYDAMADQLYKGFVPTRNFFYPGHKHHQGSAYGIGRFAHEVEASLLISRMGFPNPCVTDQGQVPYFAMYNRTPDGLLMVEGDDYARGGGPDWYSPSDLLFAVAGMYQDPYVQDDALRYGSRVGDAALRLLIQDEKLQPKRVGELPLTRYFGSPFGAMIARTAWDIQGGKDAGGAVARFHVKEYMFGNHDHLDAGHFSLYYKGALAIDSGVYQGTIGQYGSDHFKSYYQRTVAHNTLLILDPDEPKPLWWGRELETRDGGQFWPDPRRSEFGTVEQLLSCGRRAEILAHEFGPDPMIPDYSYLKGDLSPSYEAPDPYPAKVSEVKRSFVFVNLRDGEHPAALIVFDRVVSTGPSFRKAWVLHTINEPEIAGSVITAMRTEDGYNGRLVSHTLLPGPGDADIAKVGGPDREFWVDGRNYPNPPRGGSHEPGAWRIELSPKAPAATDLFLNVLQVLDAAGGPAPLTPAKVETDALIGVRIADRVVCFSKSGERLTGELTLSVVDGGGKLRYLVTDLEAGEWRLIGPATADLTVTAEGGAASFEGPAGEYRLVLAG